MTPAERIRAALEAHGSRRQGRDWQCPAHEDQQASLSVAEGRDSRVVLHCHAGCRPEDVTATLGLGWADLFPEGRKGKAEIVATYDYTDEQGRLLYQSVRYFPKGFKRRRPDGNGGWTWNLKDTRLVLYRLPKVLAAVEAGEVVYVVEGEKDVHAVERAGATATTNLGGASGAWPPAFSRLLAKTKVVVVADDDPPGHDRARRIAATVADRGGQVELARPATGKDAADHLADGKSLADLLPLDQQPETGPAEDGAALLDELYGTLTRYVVFPGAEAAVAATLWVAASHAQPGWEHATRLVVKSPVKRCGKSRFLDLLAELSHAVLPTVNISVAALVRSIGEDDPPTVLMDEADTVFARRRGERAEAAEDLRGILNAGHQRGRPYIRWDASSRGIEQCPTFAMAALAGIGDLPDTIEDRSVVITMRRRAPGEQVASLRRRRDVPGLHELRDRLHGWVRANRARLQDTEPVMPVEDRAADVWEPLVAIADAAGAGWPELARDACRKMTSAATADDDGSLGERLLADLKDVFTDERLGSEAILERLRKVEEAPWADLYGKGLDARALARLLRPYGVRPKVIRVADKTPRGYERADLLDPWRRYVPERNDRNDRNRAGDRVADRIVLLQHDDERNAPTSEVAQVADVAEGELPDGRLPGVDPGDPARWTR